MSAFTSKRCSYATVQSRSADLEQLAAWIVEGKLRPSVAHTFALSDIGTALSTLDSGNVRGKIAVRIGA